MVLGRGVASWGLEVDVPWVLVGIAVPMGKLAELGGELNLCHG